MNDYGIRPEPAQWALDAGLPAPREEEGFIEYVERLGLNAADMLVDLTARTAELANLRLVSTLRRLLPKEFDEYVRDRYDACH